MARALAFYPPTTVPSPPHRAWLREAGTGPMHTAYDCPRWLFGSPAMTGVSVFCLS